MTAPYWSDGTCSLYLGDSRDVLAGLPDDSVDAVVTDPPYELGFMGKTWDASGIAYDPAMWAECLRILKPGGYLLAFGGTRTWHRMVSAIEDAGFDIRDGIADLTGQDAPGLIWTYGSGFPKSLDVGKAIDKRRDWSLVERLSGEIRRARAEAGMSLADIGVETQRATDGQYGKWYHRGGHMFFETGRNLPSRPEWSHLREVLPIRDEFHAVYEAAEREVIGETTTNRNGGSWAEQVRSGMFQTGERTIRETAPATEEAARWSGWGTALKPAWEPIAVARKPVAGTVAANVLTYGTGALNIDACRTTAGQDYRDKCASVVGLGSNLNGDAYGEWTSVREDSAHVAGRWPANLVLTHSAACAGACEADCPVAELDRQSGATGSNSRANKGGYLGYHGGTRQDRAWANGDEGGASRFFPVFRYEAKAPASERPRLADGTAHTTVKPLALMRWLVRLVTPPGGTVLDPFAGSGTTGEACAIEGFQPLLIEQDPAHAELIKTRLAKPMQAVLGFEEPA